MAIGPLEERAAKLLRVAVDEAVVSVRSADELARDIENQLLLLKTELVVAVAARHKFEKEAAVRRHLASTALLRAEDLLRTGGDQDARIAAGELLVMRHDAETFDKLATDRREQAERLRGLYLELQKKRESVKIARQSLLAHPARTHPVSAADVDRLIEELRSRETPGQKIE